MTLRRSLVPDTPALQSFEAAARYGSFTQAAAERNLTQSAVSRQIRDLEAQLGIKLFDRVRQRVILSDAGRRLLPEVQRLLAQVEQMTLRALGSRDHTGVLAVATLPTFGARWLMPRLPGFLAAQPGTQVTVASRAGSFDLAAEGFDLAIHYGQPVWPQASCTYLCSETVVPVAGPALAAALAGTGPEALAAQPLLHMEARPKLWADWFAAAGLDSADAFRGHRFDQFSMIIEAAAAGLGVALVPRYLIEQELRDGRLQIVAGLPMATDLAYYVVLPEGKIANPLCRAFQDWALGAVSPQSRA